MLTPQEAEATLAIALTAALADGRTGAEERDQIKALFETLGGEADLPALATLHQRAALGRIDPIAEAGRLSTPEAKRAAFEIAVCVADADGAMTDREQAFLDSLERALGLEHDAAVAFEREADAVALAEPDDGDDPAVLLEPGPAHLPVPAPAPGEPGGAEGDARSSEVDGIVMRYAILNGALELLPQNLATMAILPLQTRMVYVIGKRYGYALGPGHIKEFIATLGLGATSQMLENFARKALGKLAKKALGKTAGTIAKTATGPMMTFASTYAIGRVAKAYYAGGRTLSAVDLRSMFRSDVDRGRALYERHRPEIEANARSLNPGRVLEMVRGRTPV